MLCQCHMMIRVIKSQESGHPWQYALNMVGSELMTTTNRDLVIMIIHNTNFCTHKKHWRSLNSVPNCKAEIQEPGDRLPNHTIFQELQF